MYKSPIDIVTTDIMAEIVKEQENQVFKAVQNVGILVDKEELIKALKYDRQQYKKGYADGVKDVAERLKGRNKYYCTNADDLKEMNFVIDNIVEEMVGRIDD